MTETISRPFENLTMPEQQTRQTASLPEPHITITITTKILSMLNKDIPFEHHQRISYPISSEPKIATGKTTNIRYISNIYIKQCVSCAHTHLGDRWRHQNRLVFGKLPGGGGHFQSKNYVVDF